MIRYQIREHDDGEDRGRPLLTTELPDESEAWDLASRIAAKIPLGADIFRLTPNRVLGPLDCMPPVTEEYVISYCGGGPYWWLPGSHGGGMHQIGQARFGQPSFCWTCYRDTDGDLPSRGLIHHPDVPAEVGQEHYQALTAPLRLDDTCEACGAGFSYLDQTDTIGYAEHDITCPLLHRGQPEYSYA